MLFMIQFVMMQPADRNLKILLSELCNGDMLALLFDQWFFHSRWVVDYRPEVLSKKGGKLYNISWINTIYSSQQPPGSQRIYNILMISLCHPMQTGFCQ